jgi:hypothetical protein
MLEDCAKAGLTIRSASIDLNLLSKEAVLTPVVVVAAIETERYPEIETLLASSVLTPVEAAGAWVAGVMAVVVDPPPPPPHALSVSASRIVMKARRIDFIKVSSVMN